MVIYKLRDGINRHKLTNHELSLNPNAVEYLKKYPNKIDFYGLSLNHNAVHLIEDNMHILCNYAENLNKNPGMINLLRNNPHLINYNIISFYEHGIWIIDDLIKTNREHLINWNHLSANPKAIDMLEKNMDKINWNYIIENKKALTIVSNNLDKIHNWYRICEQPHLIPIIENNIHMINWKSICNNTKAINILKNNMDCIMVSNLCSNDEAFDLMINNHVFNNGLYSEKIVIKYFDYCKKNNLVFPLVSLLCKYGSTDEHFEYLFIHDMNYEYLSKNPNIFVYDYEMMRNVRREQPYYLDITNLLML